MDADQPLKTLFRLRARSLLRLIGEGGVPPERYDLLFTLQALCGGRYTDRQLARLIPREAVMASVMFAKEFRQARAEGMAKGLAKGRVQGRIEGRIEAAREACLDIVRSLHPRAVSRVAGAVAACQSPKRLRNWSIAAARLSAEDLVELMAGRRRRRPEDAVVRGRAPRPSRRSGRRTQR